MAIQFTEAEWLIMSSLAYVIPDGKFDGNGYPLPNQNLRVEDLLDRMKKQATNGGMDERWFESEKEKNNYLAAIEKLSEKLKSGNFVVSKCINHNSSNESGLVTFAIEPNPNPDNEVIICCRGSDDISAENLNDWIGADAALAWDTQTQQQAELEEFMKGFEKYDDIYLTGHSLGGNLAMYGAVSFPYTDKIAGVYSFDGPGFNQAFIAEHIEVIFKLHDKIYNFQNEHDLVSSSLISIGQVIIIDSALVNPGVLVNHNRWAFSVNEDGSLQRNWRQKKDGVCQAWNGATIDLGLKLTPIAIIGSLIDYYNFKNAGICRDFSEATKQLMLEAAKETENEKWWQVTRWDCWYKVQDYFGFLEWDKFTGNVDDYYRKLIDINDGSVEEIEKIFTKVYQIDQAKSNSIVNIKADLDKLKSKFVEISESIVPSI